MFKDKDKQREANRLAQAKFKAKGITKGITTKVLLEQGITQIPKEQMCITDDWQKAIDAKPERTDQGNIRVSKPGDADYVPQCETTRAFIEGRDKRPESCNRGKDIKLADELSESIKEAGKIRRGEIKASRVTTFPKRGKEIKCFADLPPDIQQTINTLSDDKTEHKRRTAIAINYQHLSPDRYHSTGI